MSENNFPVSNDEINELRQFLSQSSPSSLMNFGNSQQIFQQGESEGRQYSSSLGDNYLGYQFNQIQDFEEQSVSINFSDNPESQENSLISYRNEEIEEQNIESEQNAVINENQLNFSDYFLDEPENYQMDIEQLYQQINNQNFDQMNEQIGIEIRQLDQSSPILNNIYQVTMVINLEQQNPLPMRKDQIPRHNPQIVEISSDESEISEKSQSEPQKDLSDQKFRPMNDMMRQTFVAMQFSIDLIHFPQDYATLQSFQTQEKIRQMFEIMKKFLEDLKRKNSGNQKVKSIPMKKAAMVLFNQVDLRLNEELRHINIDSIKIYLDKCKNFDEQIVNQAKHCLRREVIKMMSRRWIYDMSSEAIFREQNRKSYREFLQKYMQHIVKQLKQGKINPKAFGRDYILNNYLSYREQINSQQVDDE